MNEDIHPFGSIALCLSGGGYRAAAFSLGTLAYLHHLGILNAVDFISSTSGGTITNSFYSFQTTRDIPFRDIYNQLLEKLKGEDVLGRAVAILDNEEEWKEGKTRTIINAFAKAYDRHLFQEEALFGSFWAAGPKTREVCFNCTEFSKGLTFRFQTDGNTGSREKVGNNYIYFRGEDALKKIRLADILAASSCFPIGFEPILLPQDFAHKNLTEMELSASISIIDYDTKVRSLHPGECIGLMDGGITDNQALRSAILSDDRRRRKNQPFDLFLITDVTSYFITPYGLPHLGEGSKWGNWNLSKIFTTANRKTRQLSNVRWWVTVGVIVLVALAFILKPMPLRYISLFLAGASTLAAGISWWILTRYKKEIGIIRSLDDEKNVFLLQWLPSAIRALKAFNSSNLDRLVHFITNIKFKDFWQLLKTRIDSVTNMASDINLKHARRLIFNAFFDEPKWRGRRCANFIYELSTFNSASRERRINSYEKWTSVEKQALLLPQGHPLEVMAETARTMGTTLWFSKSEKEKLEKIVLTGQFSACANLLEYVINLQKDIELNSEQRIKITGIQKQLEDDWDRFLKEADFLHRSLKST